jgi:hypothetical protein
VNLHDDQDKCGESHGDGPCEIPTGEQWPAKRLRLRLGRLFDRRERECDDGATAGTDSKMGERLLSFVRRKRVLDKCVELICVWMEPGLEEFAHG